MNENAYFYNYTIMSFPRRRESKNLLCFKGLMDPRFRGDDKREKGITP
jgi:hypothetical protein